MPEIYVTAKKDTLEEILNLALRQVRDAPAGAVSVQIYANPGDESITFSDDDSADMGDDQVHVEVF